MKDLNNYATDISHASPKIQRVIMVTLDLMPLHNGSKWECKKPASGGTAKNGDSHRWDGVNRISYLTFLIQQEYLLAIILPFFFSLLKIFLIRIVDSTKTKLDRKSQYLC